LEVDFVALSDEELAQMNLLNLIASSTVHLIVFDQSTRTPLQFGSGFVAGYRDRLIVISADHVTRLKGKDVYTLIETGLPSENGQTLFYNIGGLVFFDAFAVDKVKTMEAAQLALYGGEPLDVTFTSMGKDIKLIQKGFTYLGEEIDEGSKVFPVLEHATIPREDGEFGFCGFIHNQVFGEEIIKSEITFQLGLEYKGTYSGYHLFNTPEVIKDKHEFEGTSGAPIFNQEGQLVGLVCNVLENSKSVFAFPIDYCMQLIDLAIENLLL
jgi:hypothetical protein